MNINVIGDTRDFDRMVSKYLVLSRKTPAEIANKLTLDVGIRTIIDTDYITSQEIETDLKQPSRVNPKVNVATILAAKAGMSVDKFIRKRKQSANYARAWAANGVRTLKKAAKKGGFVPRVRARASLGDATPAQTLGGKATATIFARYGGDNAKLNAVQQRGLAKAKAAKAADMVPYIKRKLEELATGAKR